MPPLLYSVAHYYERNGDLVPDADVVFVRRADGWSPVSFQDSLAVRAAVHFHEDSTIEIDEKERADVVVYIRACGTSRPAWSLDLSASVSERRGGDRG